MKTKLIIILLFTTHSLHSSTNNITALIQTIGVFASLGSIEECADEIHSNRENMLSALYQLPSHQLVINHYETKAMQKQLHKNAIGNRDIVQQAILDCQYAIEKWNKDTTHTSCKCFFFQDTWYDLNSNGTWQQNTTANKINETYIMLSPVRFEQDSTNKELQAEFTKKYSELINIYILWGKRVFLNTDSVPLKEEIEKKFSHLLEPKSTSIEQKSTSIESKPTNNTKISSYTLALGGVFLVGCIIAILRYSKKI